MHGATVTERKQEIMKERLAIGRSGTFTSAELRYIETGLGSDFFKASASVGGYSSVTKTELPKYGDMPSKGIEPIPEVKPIYQIGGDPWYTPPGYKTVKEPEAVEPSEPIRLLDKYLPTTTTDTITPETKAWYKTPTGTKYVTETVTWETIEPTLTSPYRYMLKHQDTDKTILRTQYEKIYEQSIITGDVDKLQSFWDKLYGQMSESKKEEWLRKFTNIAEVEEKERKKLEEESKLEWWQKLGAYIFMPMAQRIEYAKQSLIETRFKPGTMEPVAGATIFESPGMAKVRESTEQQYLSKFKSGDVKGIFFDALSSPLPTALLSYGAGFALGGLKASKWGAKSILQVGLFEQKVASAPAWTYKYTINITRAGAIEKSVAGYFTYETGKGAVEAYKEGRLSDYLTMAAVTAPFVVLPFHYGTRAGMGYVQKAHAMGKLTDSKARIQQQALYDAMKISRKLKEPKYDVKPYSLSKVEKVHHYENIKVANYLQSVRAKYIHKATIGGSTAMDIQYPPGFYRSGGYPKRLVMIAKQRQQWAFETGLQKGTSIKPLKFTGKPADIDLLLRGLFAKEKSPTVSMLKRLDVHVHKSRVGQYYGFGETTFPNVKGRIIDPFGKATYVKLISKREQFMRTAISSLPSEQPITGYRAGKDIFGMYDTGMDISWQKGGGKLRGALDRFMYHEKHLGEVPKVTFGERFIKRIGGAVEPVYVETPSGSSIKAFYPKHIYPKTYTPVSMIPSYSPMKADYSFLGTKPYGKTPKIPVLKQLYPPSGYKIPDIITPKTLPYKPPKTPSYVPSLPTYTPPYKPPDYTPPPPIITFDYKPPPPPTYTPPPPPTIIPPTTPPPPIDDYLPKQRKNEIEKLLGTKKYKYRQFKIRDILKDLGIEL